jgi:glycosyltransferase involved in cell wall biosynthesis
VVVQMPPKVSLVMTVLNEAEGLGLFLASLDAQLRHPDEVVVVDGGSTDSTVEILREWERRADTPLKLEVSPGVNISSGRNIGIRLASHDTVAVTDAGTMLDPRWLQQLVSALGDEVDVVSGFFVPTGNRPFQRMLAATITPIEREVDPQSFLPSSRSVLFRRQAWADAGGYPEWLDYCEDLVFDLQLKKMNCKFTFQPDARVSWGARPSLVGFAKQYYRYARGDGKAGLWPRRHAVRYASYASLGILLSGRSSMSRAIILGGAVLYVRNPMRRVLERRHIFGGNTEFMMAFVVLPVILLTGDVSKMAGYPVGLAWRLRHGRSRTRVNLKQQVVTFW